MSAKNQAAEALDVIERDPPAMERAAPTGPPEKWGMIYLLARIFYAMRQRTEDALKPHNLTPMQFTILASLKSWNGLSSAELSRRFGVTPQTMGEMIGNLERRSLIARVQDPANRRALRLSLTRAGEQLLDACEAAMQAVEAEMFADISPRDMESLRARMVGLHNHLGLTFAD
jgi:DNA-binding MarR family transcriptional regulator